MLPPTCSPHAFHLVTWRCLWQVLPSDEPSSDTIKLSAGIDCFLFQLMSIFSIVPFVILLTFRWSLQVCSRKWREFSAWKYWYGFIGQWLIPVKMWSQMTNCYRAQRGRAKTEGRTLVGGEGGRLKRHNIEIFCLTFLITCLWLALQEDLKREISSFTFGFSRSLSFQESLHEYENTNYMPFFENMVL